MFETKLTFRLSEVGLLTIAEIIKRVIYAIIFKIHKISVIYEFREGIFITL